MELAPNPPLTPIFPYDVVDELRRYELAAGVVYDRLRRIVTDLDGTVTVELPVEMAVRVLMQPGPRAPDAVSIGFQVVRLDEKRSLVRSSGELLDGPMLVAPYWKKYQSQSRAAIRRVLRSLDAHLNDTARSANESR